MISPLKSNIAVETTFAIAPEAILRLFPRNVPVISGFPFSIKILSVANDTPIGLLGDHEPPE
jgi:hypothetical protein